LIGLVVIKQFCQTGNTHEQFHQLQRVNPLRGCRAPGFTPQTFTATSDRSTYLYRHHIVFPNPLNILKRAGSSINVRAQEQSNIEAFEAYHGRVLDTWSERYGTSQDRIGIRKANDSYWNKVLDAVVESAIKIQSVRKF
jgi:hypothetical protein